MILSWQGVMINGSLSKNAILPYQETLGGKKYLESKQKLFETIHINILSVYHVTANKGRDIATTYFSLLLGFPPYFTSGYAL